MPSGHSFLFLFSLLCTPCLCFIFVSSIQYQGGALPDYFLFLFSFPCSRDRKKWDWPPCKVIYFRVGNQCAEREKPQQHQQQPDSACWVLSGERMRGLARDGTAEPFSRDQNLRRERGQEKFMFFSVQLTTSRIGNNNVITILVYRMTPNLMTMATYIYIYIVCT